MRELNQADYETKLDIIRKLVQRIEIDDDNVHIVFRLKELARKGVLNKLCQTEK
ncbi:murC-like protein [Wolbachia endosymbiont of Culex quinquefasciatus JHB]|nr:murC-like protein [Wolbachia endosymbiont of Culex quinquefasciatus JHB]